MDEGRVRPSNSVCLPTRHALISFEPGMPPEQSFEHMIPGGKTRNPEPEVGTCSRRRTQARRKCAQPIA